MATLTLEIEDKEVKFFKEMLKRFSFVHLKKAELDEDTDEQVMENLRQGIKEMRLIERGKLKGTPFKDFLKELDAV